MTNVLCALALTLSERHASAGTHHGWVSPACLVVLFVVNMAAMIQMFSILNPYQLITAVGDLYAAQRESMRAKERRARRVTLDNSRNLFEAIRRNDDKAVTVALELGDVDLDYAHRPGEPDSTAAHHADEGA